MMPVIVRHAISGRAHINTEDVLFNDPLSLAMLIDIFSERGYHAETDIHRIEIPQSVEKETGNITCRTKKVVRIGITFQGSEIRRGS
jgi:adenylate kinase